MKCPFCKKKLQAGELKEFETVWEHVENPNYEDFPLRPTWFCDCEMSLDCFWDEWGEFYFSIGRLPHEQWMKRCLELAKFSNKEALK